MAYRNGLGDRYDLGTGFVPVDMQTAQTGKRLAMQGLYSVDVVLIKAAGTAGDDPTLTLKSHTAASGGTSANLAIITEYFVKREATLDNDEVWERFTQSAAATIADPGGATTSAEEQQIVVFTVANEELPAGHKYISVDVADTGTNAQLGTVLYIMHPQDKKALPTDFKAPLS
jgi:hypothetical protein